MLDKLKSLWTKWKVQVSVVGGILVIATAFGTCSVDPTAVSDADVAPATETTTPTNNTVEVSSEANTTTNTVDNPTATTGE